MKRDKNTIIAAGIICLLLIFIFLFIELVLTCSIIHISNINKVLITPLPEGWENSFSYGLDSDIDQTPYPPGVYSVGMLVAVSNTGGDGLRIRSKAGLEGTPLYLGQEGEKFTIISGPRLVDNTIWWEVESQEYQNKNGWAVQDYLNIEQK